MVALIILNLLTPVIYWSILSLVGFKGTIVGHTLREEIFAGILFRSRPIFTFLLKFGGNLIWRFTVFLKFGGN